jgi:hypothetical protein
VTDGSEFWEVFLFYKMQKAVERSQFLRFDAFKDFSKKNQNFGTVPAKYEYPIVLLNLLTCTSTFRKEEETTFLKMINSYELYLVLLDSD